MSSRTHRDQGPTTTPSPDVPADLPPEAAPGATSGGGGRHRPGRRWVVVVLAVALVLAVAAGGYLLVVARAWQDRAESLEGSAHGLGGDLGQVRAELEESRSTLALVESQLDGAQEQIHELADTVAQSGDDREVQRQVLEYQTELFAAATSVTGTMSECITGQNEYIVALEGEYVKLRSTPEPDDDATETPSPDATEEPAVDLAGLREDAVASCEAAAEAHESLQERLDDA